MLHTQKVEKPQQRGGLRRFLGKEYFILRRRLKWLNSNHRFAKVQPDINFPHEVIRHKSMLLRPLKDVDMYLQHNKITNLKIAISRIDGVVIKPGQVFSFWKLVGRPTKAKGYLDGLVLQNGRIAAGTGGGLCQLGNLLYWMALHSDLAIRERWRHGFDVFPDSNRTVPFGCGATLSYNYIDLQIENNTNNDYQIKLWLDEIHLWGCISCSTKPDHDYHIEETDHVFTQQWWGGYTRHNKIWRHKMKSSGIKETTELVAENNAIMMYAPFLEK